MIKNGFLQQNSFDDVDKYCTPAKQMLLLETIMIFHRRSEAAVKAGIPLSMIVALPIRERITRLKSEVPNEKLEDIRAVAREIVVQFDELQRRRSGEETR
jgi:V/A-type H+-transporting ATPase subunit A